MPNIAFNFGYVEAVGLLRDMLDERGIQEGQIATLVWKSLKRTTRLVICFLLSAVLPYGMTPFLSDCCNIRAFDLLGLFPKNPT